MNLTLTIPNYSKGQGLKIEWEYGFLIDTKVIGNSIKISANEAGLISLAKQLLTLAQKEVPAGYHYHLDENNSLEEGAIELIIEKQ